MVRKHKTENQKSVSGSSKELSGAEKRKRKEEESKNIPALQATAAKFFKLSSVPSTSKASGLFRAGSSLNVRAKVNMF